jgi:nucleoside-diphosphate kinase
MEQTLVVIKPDALQRGIAGDVIHRLEKVGLKMVACKMFIPNEELLNKHYPTDRTELVTGMGERTLEGYKELGLDPIKLLGSDDPHTIGLQVQKWLVEFMISAPVVAMVWEGPHAIEVVRKIRGATLPLKALPGTINGDYSFDSAALGNSQSRPIKNLVHASGNVEEAGFEISLWFDKSELFPDYVTLHQAFMNS